MYPIRFQIGWRDGEGLAGDHSRRPNTNDFGVKEADEIGQIRPEQRGLVPEKWWHYDGAGVRESIKGCGQTFDMGSDLLMSEKLNLVVINSHANVNNEIREN